MDIVLNKPELAKYVEEQVRAGRYDSPEGVVAAALARQIQDERLGDFAPGEWDALLAEAEEDVARGDLLTLEEVREHFRRRAADAGQGK